MHRSAIPLIAVLLVPAATKPIHAQATATDPWATLALPTAHKPTPTTSAITPADLMTRLFLFADDSMGGRLLGTQGNARGVEYIASELKRMGVEPAGDDGTYFQNVYIVSREFDSTTTISVDGRALVAWEDYIPRDQHAETRSLDGVQTVFGGTWGDPNSLMQASAADGKLVVLAISPAGYLPGAPGAVDRAKVVERFPAAAGIAIAGLDIFPPGLRVQLHQPQPGTRTESPKVVPTFLYVSKRVAGFLLGRSVEGALPGQPGRTVSGNARFVEQPLSVEVQPRNVVGIIRGSDAAVRNQFVAIGAHNDHIGTTGRGLGDLHDAVPHDSIYVVNHLFRQSGADDDEPKLTAVQARQVNSALATIRQRTGGASARIDSVYNGADDDGSGSMSVLELAQYFAGQATKPKRSLLFIWHVGEEEGLFGSQWFTDHPTIPRDSIVAELNIDMIGRGAAADVTGMTKTGKQIHGNTNYLQVIGSRRLSTELGDLVESVNTSGNHLFAFDYELDANGHPQQIYCRSDHERYARYGIPIAFFTTGGHADYHQVTDEPQYIDYTHMARVVRFIADLSSHVANLDHRIVVDKPKPDPNGICQQ